MRQGFIALFDPLINGVRYRNGILLFGGIHLQVDGVEAVEFEIVLTFGEAIFHVGDITQQNPGTITADFHRNLAEFTTIVVLIFNPYGNQPRVRAQLSGRRVRRPAVNGSADVINGETVFAQYVRVHFNGNFIIGCVEVYQRHIVQLQQFSLQLLGNRLELFHRQ